MPAARAFCARRATQTSTSLPCCIMRSANSSTTITIIGRISGSSCSPSGSSSRTRQDLLEAVVVASDDRLAERVLDLAREDALHPAVVRADVLRAGVGEELVAALHLVDGPLERVRRLLHVGDDRQEHVRDAVERRELDDLRIDHEQAQLLGRAPEEERREHHVETDALAGAGRAGDDRVRHAREIGVDGVADDVATEHDGERHVERLEAAILDEVAQVHRRRASRSGARSRSGSCPGSARRCGPSCASASARSSASAATLLTFVPATGETSNVVTIGPGRISSTLPRHLVVGERLHEQLGVRAELRLVEHRADVRRRRDEHVERRQLEGRAAFFGPFFVLVLLVGWWARPSRAQRTCRRS